VKNDLKEKIIKVATHTVTLALILASIALIQYGLGTLLRRDPLIFRFVRLTDLASLSAIGIYLWRVTGLLQGEINKRITEEEPEERASKPRRLAILELLADFKSNRARLAFFMLLFSSLLYVAVSRQFEYEMQPGIFIIVGFLLVALYINQKALTYRIRKGVYGTNAYEARELIAYIISNSDKEDFFDGDDPKRLLLPPEQDARTEPVFDAEVGDIKG
jgi:hypothetical protein